MPASPTGFSSVKLPAALVQQAHEAAQAAIQGFEAAAKQARGKAPDALEALKTRVLAASTNGVLQADIRTLVEENRQQAVQLATA